jgi:hypothetical protein
VSVRAFHSFLILRVTFRLKDVHLLSMCDVEWKVAIAKALPKF